MPELYLPPKEISFRLKSSVTNYVLYSRDKNDPTFYHYGGGVADDQWWQLVPGTGTYNGYYLIKSKYTGKVIFSRASPDPRVGHIGGDGMYADNYFKFEEGSGKHKGQFRVRNYSSDMVLFSRESQSPYLGNYSGTAGVYDDQYWFFHFEDMTLNRVEYKLDQGQIIASNTETIGTESVTNGSDINQTVEFELSDTKSTSTNFEHSHGFTVGVEVSGKVEIPFVAEGELKVSASTTHTWTWGKTETESKTFTSKFSAAAPPHKKVTATASITRATVEVPYTMYWRSVATGNEVSSSGTYRGVTFWNLSSVVKQTDI
ncbi:hemolytic lectin LSLb [Arthroderma uncinatum]|uniref:hemolytic lectin LSLb n=1 Tax=Arthroderma uncinatum TaxID=74035 RepID=UPI00144A4FFE|nr:hemolytic lectin LSLb [Arthroderma uncinatum]KAF3484075.1 hemolytic lectin LSLb [Arthroderma uncinatum]